MSFLLEIMSLWAMMRVGFAGGTVTVDDVLATVVLEALLVAGAVVLALVVLVGLVVVPAFVEELDLTNAREVVVTLEVVFAVVEVVVFTVVEVFGLTIAREVVVFVVV